MRKTLLTAALAAACFTAATLAVAQAPDTKKAGCCATAEATAGCGMTAEQQKAHKERMAGMKDETSCRAYLEETRGKMGCGKEGHAMSKDMERGCDHMKKKT